MMPSLEEGYRSLILENLEKLEPMYQELFRRRYAVQASDTDVKTVVANMPAFQLYWAFQEVKTARERTEQ